MDICFLEFNEWVHLRVNSVHGMLWLQTHFEDSQWEAIASQQVKLTKNNAKALAADATEAGLILNSVQSALNFSNS
ncbi:hypothetical protein [Prochlorococcus marinus]|uniref:hypothetical protein n=1 Tax=Prochlorococcus marinus TaxID=1219 RepID=UPI0022B5D543|nr:hypothetical protein [Prochlorococcus marinus]